MIDKACFGASSVTAAASSPIDASSKRHRPARGIILPDIVVSGIAALVLLMSGCGGSARIGEDDPLPSEGIRLAWGVVENMAGGQNRFESELIIRNDGRRTLPREGWAMFFNFIRSIDTSTVTPIVRIDHINGDFYRLRPTETFPRLRRGDEVRITFTADAWAINETDRPDGFYFVWGDEEEGRLDPLDDPDVLPFTEESQLRRVNADRYPVATAARLYREYATVHELPAGQVPKIIPRPRAIEFRDGVFAVDAGDVIGYDPDLEGEARYLADAMGHLLSRRPVVAQGDRGEIVLLMDSTLTSEGYSMVISGEGIRIAGGSPAGVFYGIQSLRALIPLQAYSSPGDSIALPYVQIADEPRFEYRGMHLDVARTFHSPAAVKRLLDMMSFYKLNKFHFHLTDDEGWRLEIQELPELTTVGGRRGHTLSEEEHLIPSLGSGPFADPARSRGSGFYTRREFIDILRYARDRHIEVIPEIDLPGHARAAIVAMEARHRRTGSNEYRLSDPLDASEYRSVQMFTGNVVDVCLPSTYRFIEVVVANLVEMYREAGVPFRTLHTGGDEVPAGVWERSPACESLIRTSADVNSVDDLHDYFLRQVDEILNRHDLVTAGWEEIALYERDGRKAPNPAFVGAHFQPYVWNTVWGWGGEEIAYKLANAGYDVVISSASAFYFDMAHHKHPEEHGMYWAGFVNMTAPFAFMPFDLYKSAQMDMMGREIPDDAYQQAERLTLVGREHILGLQGQLWGETMDAPEWLDHMLFPRLISLAERAWAPRPDWALVENRDQRNARLDRDWNRIANALGRRELPRLDLLWEDVNYRIPPPGAVIEDGVLKANAGLPGFEIRYTVDGSHPTPDSNLYTSPIRVEDVTAVEADGEVDIRLRSFNQSGRGSRTVRAEVVR